MPLVGHIICTYHSVLRITNNLIPTSNEEGGKLKGSDHMRLYTTFCSGEAAAVRNVDISTVKKIGMKLKIMHAQRVKSDYKLDHKINRITAISTINDSEEIDKIVNRFAQVVKSVDTRDLKSLGCQLLKVGN